MKCSNCGSSNRRGIKYCEECGVELKSQSSIKKPPSKICPSCGFKNRKGVMFCEECGTELVVDPTPKSRRSKKDKPPAAPPVVVKEKEEKKRKLKLLWLLVILLLLLICCCGLLVTENLEIPNFIAPYVKPYIGQYLHDIRDWYGDLIKNRSEDGKSNQDGSESQQGEDGVGQEGGGNLGNEPETDNTSCDWFRNIFSNPDCWILDTGFGCNADFGLCWLIFDGNCLDDYSDLKLEYQWDDGEREEADCEKKQGTPENYISCVIDFDPDANNSLVAYLTHGECKEEIYTLNTGMGQENINLEFTCEDFSKKVADGINLEKGFLSCYPNDGKCELVIEDITGLDMEDYSDVGINYLWGLGTGSYAKADCDGGTSPLKCELNFYPGIDIITLFITNGGCERFLSSVDGWLERVESFNKTNMTSDCCRVIEVSDVHYEGTPGVTRLLHFDVECDQNWPVDLGECIPGDTFIGENQDIYWADVTCCAESKDLKLLHCVSDSSVEQKVSWTTVRMLKEGCAWESPAFYTPPLTKPSGKSDSSDPDPGEECIPPECYP